MVGMTKICQIEFWVSLLRLVCLFKVKEMEYYQWFYKILPKLLWLTVTTKPKKVNVSSGAMLIFLLRKDCVVFE